MAACGLLQLAGVFAFLAWAWDRVFAGRWFIISGLVTAYILWMVRSALGENKRHADLELLPYLGAANGVSLARGLMIAAVMGFLFSPRPPGWLTWIPGLLYTVAALLDFVDGYLARRLNQGTRLGEILDMNFDGLGILAATLLVVAYRQVPAWYLVVGLARYLFLFGLWVRRRLGLQIYELPPDPSRRAQAGLQMGYIFVMLWPLFSPPGTHFAAILFSLPFLSGFLWDWLAVIGVVNAPGRVPCWEIQVRLLRRFAVSWLPLALRLGMISLALGLAFNWLDAGLASEVQIPYSQTGVSVPVGLALLEWAVLGLISVGAAGRISAIVGLCLLGVHQIYLPLTAGQYWQALLYAGVLYFGTGKFSLWKPENWLIYHRAGEKPGLQGTAQVRL